ncbi:MAG: amidase [Alphaproteobacteria bacterium]
MQASKGSNAFERPVADSVAFLGAVEIARLVRERALSPVEIVDSCLAQIERLQPSIDALVAVVAQQARATATMAEDRVMRGDALGPLHGVPIVVTDMLDTAGVRTTCGTARLANHVPAQDALLVARLKRAGAILLGKANTTSYATVFSAASEVHGPTRNPWDVRRTAGGAIGGPAAAVAAGMAALGVSIDLGGGNRAAPSFCGVVGLRPTVGLIPNWPTSLPWDTLATAGPVARDAVDAALMLGAMAGPTRTSPIASGRPAEDYVEAVSGFSVEGLRVAWLADPARAGVAPVIDRACRRAADTLAAAGADLAEQRLDLSAARDAFRVLHAHWAVLRFADTLDRVDDLGPMLSQLVRRGLGQTPAELARAEAHRAALWGKLTEVLSQFDLLLTPTVPVVPFAAEALGPADGSIPGGASMPQSWLATCNWVSLLGLPAATVPVGLDEDGMPVGLQVIGPRFAEAAVLGAARLAQQALPIGLPPAAVVARPPAAV